MAAIVGTVKKKETSVQCTNKRVVRSSLPSLVLFRKCSLEAGAVVIFVHVKLFVKGGGPDRSCTDSLYRYEQCVLTVKLPAPDC